ncbi:unnamed protein product [Clavelina lepadiformis]|uniref:IRF tryptophan pentad repeat domain-containing protein n=1 Tax=Clavelina lepadiformis TaxID=159417 RepID=A0ABP0FTP8_CLALP
MTEGNIRLAEFLRERCARGEYGLKYLNRECTLICIPWTVAPKQTEELPNEFQLFREWAVLSHQRRHNGEMAEINEAPTLQKHRFRNALSRANGIKVRQDIAIDGGRVCEFVPSRRPSEQRTLKPACEASQDRCDAGSFLSEMDMDYRQVEFSPRPCEGNGLGSEYLPQDMPQFFQDYAAQTSEQDDLERLLDGMMPDVTAPSINQQTYGASVCPIASSDEAVHFTVKLRFRQEEVFRSHVTNLYGCRLYYGHNTENISWLLEKGNLFNQVRPLKYDKDTLFGPEMLQQIKLPNPDQFMKSALQKNKTDAILNNMDRGLILWLDHNLSMDRRGVPDVYAMRLCQTRIFPVTEDENPVEPLARQQWTKIFDAEMFCRQLALTENPCNPCPKYPRPSFTLSLGQRVTDTQSPQILVSVTVTIQRAHQLVQIGVDNSADVKISNATSLDETARSLARALKEMQIN